MTIRGPESPGSTPRRGASQTLSEPAMNAFHDAAYNMAAVSATVALYRALIKKGVLAREEAARILLDEAVAQAIQAEAHTQGTGVSKTTMDINRQCADT